MTKVTNSVLNNQAYFEIFIENLKPEYLSDISWAYKHESHNLVVDFYQDETGKNIIEQFCVKMKGDWRDVEPTEAQLKTMFKQLNNTPFKPVQQFESLPWENEMWENGHSEKDFYNN